MTIRSVDVKIKSTVFFFLAWILACGFGIKGFILYPLFAIPIAFLQTIIAPRWKNAFFSPKA